MRLLLLLSAFPYPLVPILEVQLEDLVPSQVFTDLSQLLKESPTMEQLCLYLMAKLLRPELTRQSDPWLQIPETSKSQWNAYFMKMYSNRI